MLVNYNFGGRLLQRDVPPISFILTNRIGGFLLMNNEPATKYHGVFYSIDKKVYKTIDNIESDEPIESLTNHLWQIERKRKTFSEYFFMPHGYNSLVYETTSPAKIRISLDIRQAYKLAQWGRLYKIELQKDCVIISFTKKTDARENDTQDQTEFEAYMVIRGNIESMKQLQEWTKREYTEDSARHDAPYEWYVFSALEITTNKLVFSFSTELNNALRESKEVLNQLAKLKANQRGNTASATSVVDAAKSCCENQLKGLCTKEEGLYAGLPWFFQYWTRDELISCKALAKLEPAFAKQLLMKYLSLVGFDGKFQNSYPSSELASADAPGWLFKRVMEIYPTLGRLEKSKVQESLLHIIYLVAKFQTKDGFLTCGPRESWMDTSFGTDDRYGHCIELQAMLLFMYKTMYQLTNEPKYQEAEEVLRQRVREKFWDGNILADREADKTIRPNIFIAAYIYPELLTQAEWISCFRTSLPKLWLEWGGLATMDKTNPLFCGYYTGQDNKSYHRGDSWYYLNNMAAIVLARTEKTMFDNYIQRILAASTDEILWRGASGHHAEVSSAAIQRSEGCKSQAWSAALFLELADELKIEKR